MNNISEELFLRFINISHQRRDTLSADVTLISIFREMTDADIIQEQFPNFSFCFQKKRSVMTMPWFQARKDAFDYDNTVILGIHKISNTLEQRITGTDVLLKKNFFASFSLLPSSTNTSFSCLFDSVKDQINMLSFPSYFEERINIYIFISKASS